MYKTGRAGRGDEILNWRPIPNYLRLRIPNIVNQINLLYSYMYLVQLDSELSSGRNTRKASVVREIDQLPFPVGDLGSY